MITRDEDEVWTSGRRYLVLSKSILSASSNTRLPLERVHKLQVIQCLPDTGNLHVR